MPRRLAPLLLALLFAVTACDALTPGVRLLRADYTVGDTVVLSTYYEDPDARPASDVWDYLAEPPVFASEESDDLPHDDADPLRATLLGEVRVEIWHVDTLLRRARLQDVTLVRPSRESACWHLPAADAAATRPR